MHERTRSRVLKVNSYSGRDVIVYKGNEIQHSDFSKKFTSVQFMHDFVNGLWNASHKIKHKQTREGLRKLDLGAPMESIKIVHDYPIAGRVVGNVTDRYGSYRRYTGDVIANPPPPVPVGEYTEAQLKGFLAPYQDPIDVLFGLGGTAISNCKPASPEAAFGTSLIELYREGIPKLLSDLDIKDAVSFYRHLRGNYLNVEFGWKPLIGDIQAVIKSYENRDKIIRQLVRNSGKPVRRRYSFPDQVTVVETPQPGRFPLPVLDVYHWTQESCLTRITTTKRTWFSGEFVYRIPKVDNTLPNILSQMRHLYGVDPSPEMVWNVAPWMWLIDWFANYGDVISNVTAISSDDLAMRYGYLMQEVIREYQTIHTGVVTQGSGFVAPRITGTTTVTSRVRIRASPYGFGLNQSALSMRQWTILTALGLIQEERFISKVK